MTLTVTLNLTLMGATIMTHKHAEIKVKGQMVKRVEKISVQTD